MYRFGIHCTVLALSLTGATTAGEKKTEPPWTPIPYSELADRLKKDGWKNESQDFLQIKFLDGHEVVSVQVGGGAKRILKQGMFRESHVVLMPAIDFLPREKKVVRWVESPSHADRDKISVAFTKGGERAYFFEKGPTKITDIAFFSDWPKDEPKEAKKETEGKNHGNGPLILSSEPARITGGTMTTSFTPYESATRKFVYVQRKVELIDGEKVIGVWFESAYASLSFVKEMPPQKKKTCNER